MPLTATQRIIWLASYPKSGNTWLRLMLASLLAGGGPVHINRDGRNAYGIAASRASFDNYLDIDSGDLTQAEIDRLRPHLYGAIAASTGERVVIKTHDRWQRSADGLPLFPAAVSAGAIVILRDPRDVALSLSHHLGRDLDASIAFMADPDACFATSRHAQRSQIAQRLGSWSDHAASWLDQDEIPVCRVHYEALLADPAAELARLAIALALPADPARIDGAVRATSFSTLQAQERAEGFSERPSHMAAFFREGRAGGWRDILTPGQVCRLESDHGAMMARLGYCGGGPGGGPGGG